MSLSKPSVLEGKSEILQSMNCVVFLVLTASFSVYHFNALLPLKKQYIKKSKLKWVIFFILFCFFCVGKFRV